MIWLLYPHLRCPQYIEPADVLEAAQAAGLRHITTVKVATDWDGAQLANPFAYQARR
ncbi:DUF3052 family protein [Streptomyces sp. CS113]|uniref:DUF3052 family protein n=1 Tax=Streptomyces sp. CS113 TaxID=1982761 RepID=UPI0015C6244A|nr:DUF3052 family protein [Streptomyces sp. CS113]